MTRQLYDVLGVPFLLESNGREIGSALRRLLGPFEVTTTRDVPTMHRFFLVHDRTAPVYRLYRDDSIVCSSGDADAVLHYLVSAINHDAIGGFGGFAAHGGVVANSEEAIAYLAESGGGKSTMVAASLAAGFDYVSDEALCVDFESRSVLPYLKPLQLSVESLRELGLPWRDTLESDEDTVTYAELGGAVASGPLELGHVVRLVRNHGRAELIEVPRVDGVAWLFERSFNHYKRGLDSFLLITELATRCRMWRLQYEHACEAVALVERHLTRDRPTSKLTVPR